MRQENLWFKPDKLILVFIFLNLLLGLFIVADYGISIDEPVEFKTGSIAWKAYTRDRETSELKYGKIPRDRYYGTALTMFFQAAENEIGKFFDKTPGVVPHYIYYIIFQIGLFSFYYLAKRFVPPWTALLTTILLGLEPLYFGHSFINPKDIPLMSVFITSVSSGLYMVDKLVQDLEENYPQKENWKDKFHSEWQFIASNKVVAFFIVNLILIIILFFTDLVQNILSKIVYSSYFSPDNTLLGRLFGVFVQPGTAIPVEAYQNKAIRIYDKYILFLYFIFFVFQVALIILPITEKKTMILKNLFSELVRYLSKIILRPKLLLASIVFGICIATRIVGLGSGGLVGLYLLFRTKQRGIVPGIMYVFFAGLVMYSMWPILWLEGLQAIVNALTLVSSFPGKFFVLFNGHIYFHTELPLSFLPTILATQYTLPVLGLMVIGFVISFLKANVSRAQLLLIASWFFIPFLYVILRNTPMYNNSRQLIFITPPLFIFVGIGLEKVLDQIKNHWVKIFFVCVLPVISIYNSISLHPYQYIYRNALVGGVEGAFREYELDYWITSLREAAEYVNQVAPENARVGVYHSRAQSDPYLRDDLRLTYLSELRRTTETNFEYLIMPTTINFDQKYFTGGEVVFEVRRENAVLIMVKKFDG